MECAPGHTARPSGYDAMECDASGIWLNRPSCLVNICDNSTYTIANGRVDFPTDSSPYGSDFSASCEMGYNVTQPSGIMNCDSEGVFVNKPSCIENTCLKNSFYVQYGQVHFPLNDSITGTNFSISCVNENFIANVTQGAIQCGPKGEWLNRSICQLNASRLVLIGPSRFKNFISVDFQTNIADGNTQTCGMLSFDNQSDEKILWDAILAVPALNAEKIMITIHSNITVQEIKVKTSRAMAGPQFYGGHTFCDMTGRGSDIMSYVCRCAQPEMCQWVYLEINQAQQNSVFAMCDITVSETV